MWNTVMVEFQQEACLDLNRIYSTGSQQLNGLIILFFDLGYSFLSNIISEWSNKNVFSKFQCRAFLSAYIRVTESHKLKVCLFVFLRRSAFTNRLTGELNNPPLLYFVAHFEDIAVLRCELKSAFPIPFKLLVCCEESELCLPPWSLVGVIHRLLTHYISQPPSALSPDAAHLTLIVRGYMCETS